MVVLSFVSMLGQTLVILDSYGWVISLSYFTIALRQLRGTSAPTFQDQEQLSKVMKAFVYCVFSA